jgi:two-component system osmolarity sensor histidine kinase EnvZ
MFSTHGRLAWLGSGLLWRTFFLLAFLIALSMAVWVTSFQVIERAPRANQIAAKVISIVTITRAALLHSAPELRRELLFDLASNEGMRVYPLEETDKVVPPADNNLMPVIEATVRQQLGKNTKFANVVNDMPGFWVSFQLDDVDDEYWLMLDRDRIESNSGFQLFGWAFVTLLMSLLGAVFISRLINQPLARLTAATRSIARGVQPEPLPEQGPTEILEANRSFNQMAADLERIESDRAIILAGISHDLRTPITRMLLEVEMASLPADARRGMLADLAQMDAIIGQFLDYARPSAADSFIEVELSQLLSEAAHDAARFPDVHINADIPDGLRVRGNMVELKRVFANLVENARRYGKTSGSDIVDLSLRCEEDDEHVTLVFADRGIGIPDGEIDHLLRPFTRLDAARGQANGAGLGLAIVDRIVKRHAGVLKLANRDGGGLAITIILPR